jgi:hypothetical protein
MQNELVLIVVVCFLTMWGCNCRSDPDAPGLSLPSGGDNMVQLTKHVASDESLSIFYRVTNDKDYPIWVCDGIDEVGRPDITMKGNTLYFRLFSRHLYPEGVLLYVPPTTLYSKLSPGESVERTIRVKLPISEQTRHVHLEHDGRSLSKERTATRVVLCLGYLTQQSVDAIGPYVRNLPQGGLEVATLEVNVEENIMEASISDLHIPVVLGS